MKSPADATAFTLTEVMVAVAVAATVFFSIYAGFSSAVLGARLAEESLRAIALLNEKVETVRLYSWSSVTNAGATSVSFTNYFYQDGNSRFGTVYTGDIQLTNGPGNVNYDHRLRTLVVTVNWSSAGISHSRQIQTLISDAGLVSRK
jgi:prepilin-type N-terminal cleavage/methylation domain-containing protein